MAAPATPLPENLLARRTSLRSCLRSGLALEARTVGSAKACKALERRAVVRPLRIFPILNIRNLCLSFPAVPLVFYINYVVFFVSFKNKAGLCGTNSIQSSKLA